MKNKFLKIIFCILITIFAIVAIYFIYVFGSYKRIDDNTKIDIYGEATSNTISANEAHRIVSANLGFGAYSDDYSFFMDGGTESWAFSKEAVNENITGSINNISSLNPEIILLQEVDVNATRSYHVNEEELIIDTFTLNDKTNMSYDLAINYDSAFLFYPIHQPHGKSQAGIMTLSDYTINDAVRRSLPIEDGFSKFMDLDRCYSKNYIDVDNGKKLVIYNVHLSAYTTDPSTAENQVIMLNSDMLEEVNNGNYVIAGGDMNKDLLGDSSKYFSKGTIEDNWAVAFPVDLLDDCFTVIGPLDEANPIPSCRNADIPYDKDKSFVLTIDGFIISSNVKCVESNVLDSQFAYSDHNPVYMNFILQ